MSLATPAGRSTRGTSASNSVLWPVLTVPRRRWFHGHSCLRGILWSGHLLGPLPAQLTPKQTAERIRLPLRRLRHDRCVPRSSSSARQTFHASLLSLVQQGLCSSGCSGPVSTPPSLTTETGSTGPPSTRTWVWPPASSPPWPSPACTTSVDGWTWCVSSDEGCIATAWCFSSLTGFFLPPPAGAHSKRHARRRCRHGNSS